MGLVSGTPTIASAGGLPYLRIDPATGSIRHVNLYDSSWTLLASNLAITRTDDNHFTAAVNYPTAAWMMDTQFATAISAGATTDWKKYDGTSKQTGVHIGWGFDQRAAALATGSQPAWLGGTMSGGVVTPGTGTGVVGCKDSDYSIGQFNYAGGSCPAIVGIVPAGSPERFIPGLLFDFPTVPVDGVYGGHSQSLIGLTMEDPFDQTPYVPSCDGSVTSWREDDGSGKADALPTAYYALRPMVEALSAIPAGCSLPTGVTLFYDPANKFPPPLYPNGIPLGASVTSDWGITARICANVTRFVADYAAWNTCP